MVFPQLNFIQLSGTSFSGKERLEFGDEARLTVNGNPIFQETTLKTSLPFLACTIANYSEQAVEVLLGTGSNARFKIDAGGFTTVTEIPFDDLIVINPNLSSVKTSDIVVTLWNDLTGLLHYKEALNSGLVTAYKRRFD